MVGLFSEQQNTVCMKSLILQTLGVKKQLPPSRAVTLRVSKDPDWGSCLWAGSSYLFVLQITYTHLPSPYTHLPVCTLALIKEQPLFS